jgi:hypothetical protein
MDVYLEAVSEFKRSLGSANNLATVFSLSSELFLKRSTSSVFSAKKAASTDDIHAEKIRNTAVAEKYSRG